MKIVAVLIAVGALAVAGCGGGGFDGDAVSDYAEANLDVTDMAEYVDLIESICDDFADADDLNAQAMAAVYVEGGSADSLTEVMQAGCPDAAERFADAASD